MSHWEVTIERVDPDSVPPGLYDADGRVYQGNKQDCDAAKRILDRGGEPRATVTDKNDNGKMMRPPLVVEVKEKGQSE